MISRLRNLNLVDLEKACTSQIKDDINKVMEDTVEDYVSLSNNEYEYFKVIKVYENYGYCSFYA